MRLFKKIISKKTVTTEDDIFINKLQNILGFKPSNLNFYKRSFTHRSMNLIGDDGFPYSYERLEFLGDAMLSSIIAAHLFYEVPGGNEGYLTKMRSKIVSREHLNELGRDYNLIQFVKSKVNPSHYGENIHGNLFEAFVGAIYLDKGFTFCEKFVYNKVIMPYVDIAKLEGKVTSYKSLIIEWCQKQKCSIYYDVYEDSANENVKIFAVKLFINKELIAKARATSKKKAEEKASQRAYFALQQKITRKP